MFFSYAITCLNGEVLLKTIDSENHNVSEEFNTIKYNTCYKVNNQFQKINNIHLSELQDLDVQFSRNKPQCLITIFFSKRQNHIEDQLSLSMTSL